MANKNFSVVVGVGREDDEGHEERENLAKTIEELGYTVERVEEYWPRDHWVFWKGKYFTKKEVGRCGEGGYFNLGHDFVIVSEKLLEGKYKAAREDVYAEVKKYYVQGRAYVAPVGYKPRFMSQIFRYDELSHIDLTCLLIPSRDLLFVDQSFYDKNKRRYKNARKIFKEIADVEGLSLKFYKSDSDESYRYFPLNCLVIPYSQKNELVVINRRTRPFVDLLKEYRIDMAEVDMVDTPKLDGSIRCCTNVKDGTKSLDDLLYHDAYNSFFVDTF